MWKARRRIASSKAPPADQPLARRDGDPQDPDEPGAFLHLLGRRRFPGKQRPSGFERAQDLPHQRQRGRAAVETHHDVDVLAHRGAQRLHGVAGLVDGAAGRDVMA